ncbi:unnamed protein product [Prorocentrum cordatum]|uniref:Uncharacterized protein n=1 Tax=Prorocentrum cordatum TaxID=2364126 RepID=A0ABN9URA4_9DINO|nr:unnamed protein product [Polarella glacialis]
MPTRNTRPPHGAPHPERVVHGGSPRSLLGEETSQCLSKYGVRLPWGTARGVAAAVVARLAEAEQSGEVEMFSGEQIVHEGRVLPGLAAVLRPGAACSPTAPLWARCAGRRRRTSRSLGCA